MRVSAEKMLDRCSFLVIAVVFRTQAYTITMALSYVILTKDLEYTDLLVSKYLPIRGSI